MPLFLYLVAFRLVNAFTISTYFQPDEYFQSLEVAWQWAFGLSSGAWITWEWHESLRSSIHPLMFAAVYKWADLICGIMHFSEPARADILIAGPKVLQALLAATTDYFTHRLARRVWGSTSSIPVCALMLTVSNPWQWFCSVRTLSNAFETPLTIAALALWPWEWFTEPMLKPTSTNAQKNSKPVHASLGRAGPGSLGLALSLAASACILRPTNIIIWATVALVLIWNTTLGRALVLINACFAYGCAILAASVAVDRVYYGKLVFPPLRFLYYNLVQSMAVFYGVNRLDYYFTEGLPLLTTTTLPFAGLGLWKALFGSTATSPSTIRAMQTLSVLALAVVVSVFALSMVSHKEVRFIYPLLPILHVLASEPLASFCHPFVSSSSKWRKALLGAGLMVNILIAYYVGYVHQRGVVDAIHYLRHERELMMPTPITVGFLMPCHSTPWRSHLVYSDIDAWALTCEPPLHLSIEDRAAYLDEADVFYADPKAWIQNNMEDVKGIARTHTHNSNGQPGRKAWPRYLVFFEQLQPQMESMLKDSKYEECWRGFNTHWHDDWRRQGDVVVWCVPPLELA